jgi:hypothetical protein
MAALTTTRLLDAGAGGPQPQGCHQVDHVGKVTDVPAGHTPHPTQSVLHGVRVHVQAACCGAHVEVAGGVGQHRLAQGRIEPVHPRWAEAPSSIVGPPVHAGLKRWSWLAYCLATAVVGPAIVAVGMSNIATAGVPFALAGAVALGWVSVLAFQLLSELGSARGPSR